MKGDWIQKPQQDTTVIFVHGILSSSEECWKNDNGTYWFNLLKEDTKLAGLGIYTFSYNTGIFSGDYSLNDAVDALKARLELDDVLKQNHRLIFVCHSMGGIVVRKYIVERQIDLINLDIQIGLFLVASPSLGSDYANLIKGFAKILNNTQADALRFSQNNTWLNGLDKEFINLKEAKHLPIIGKELIEDKSIILKGNDIKFKIFNIISFFKKQIVKPFSGARFFENPYKVENSDHLTISKPENKDAIQHRLLCQFIKDVLLLNGNADESENHNKHTPSNDVTQTRNINTNIYIEGNVKGGNVAGRDINQAQGGIVHGNKIISNVTGSSVGDSVVTAGEVSHSFNNIHNYTSIYNYYSEKEQKKIQVLVNIRHLPEPNTALIGRKTELAQLTEAIKNPNKRLGIIVAAGGIGKSALTDEWLQQIAQENYYGKTRVFGWSFYAQGTRKIYDNSQEFFNKVLPFLGITEIPKEEIEKARVLAWCLRQQPCLFILDGLEPLQYPKSMNGELQDSALKEFIACFRQDAGKSFVLFSSRQPLVELKNWQADRYLSLPLENLPHDDGAKLLQTLGVKGNEKERQDASKELNGHALSLLLMGRLLNEYHKGNIFYMNKLPPLTSANGDGDKDAEKDSRHALRVLHYYDSLQDTASRCFLQLLGLFDRPMNQKEKAVLIADAQHAEPLRDLTKDEWEKLEQHLEETASLSSKKDSLGRSDDYDVHPIVREFFRQKFKEQYPEAFKQAHLVLFEYYQKLPKKDKPETLEEMLPLYQAVVHGCLAEQYQQAYNVYFSRIDYQYLPTEISRGYASNKLGAYSQNLTALAAFFPLGLGNLPVQIGLTGEMQLSLLEKTSHYLTSLGRFLEASESAEEYLKLSRSLDDKKDASNACRMLTNLYQPQGRLVDAESVATQAVEYAKSNAEGLVLNLCRLAIVLHRKGEIENAESFFRQADEIEQNKNKQ